MRMNADVEHATALPGWFPWAQGVAWCPALDAAVVSSRSRPTTGLPAREFLTFIPLSGVGRNREVELPDAVASAMRSGRAVGGAVTPVHNGEALGFFDPATGRVWWTPALARDRTADLLDGRFAATVGYVALAIFDGRTGEVLCSRPAPEMVDLDWAADGGGEVVTLHPRGLVRTWSSAALEPLREFRVGDACVYRCAALRAGCVAVSTVGITTHAVAFGGGQPHDAVEPWRTGGPPVRVLELGAMADGRAVANLVFSGAARGASAVAAIRPGESRHDELARVDAWSITSARLCPAGGLVLCLVHAAVHAVHAAWARRADAVIAWLAARDV